MTHYLIDEIKKSAHRRRSLQQASYKPCAPSLLQPDYHPESVLSDSL